jgi:hypothetical protein
MSAWKLPGRSRPQTAAETAAQLGKLDLRRHGNRRQKRYTPKTKPTRRELQITADFLKPQE